MSRMAKLVGVWLCACAFLLVTAASAQNPVAQLEKWQIASSCDGPAKGATGDQVSTVGYATKGWHTAAVPGTVVGALVDDKTYPDPTYGTNMKQLPGMDYPTTDLFANQDMPKDSPFVCSWWWRTEVLVPAAANGKNVWIHFPGINYRANVWVNGQKVADQQDVAGTFRIFDFNLTKVLKPGAKNAVAVEVFAAQKGDLGITWVDWNPTPPDKDMGLWKEVSLTANGEVSLWNPFVTSKLDSTYTKAELYVSADAKNDSPSAVQGTLFVAVDGKEISQPVSIAAGETKTVSFTADKFAALKLAKPRLWWPYKMGTPNLYTAKLRFEVNKKVSDQTSVTFGVREVTSEMTDKGHRLFKVNGKNVLIRGAAWAPDMFLRPLPKKLDADLKYVKDMGLNTVRLEGRIDRDEFFEKTDKMGILVMPGWTCCDAWERWNEWKPETYKIAEASMLDQAKRLRNHASVYVWLYGSDGPPPADVEKLYLDVLKQAQWPNPSISSASETPTTVTGKSGVKMTGPYEYVPPVYWYADKEAGGAHGYNTETSPGPAIPTIESLKKFIPADHLWPIDDVWNYHAGGERFTNVNIFTDGLTKRYGAATSLEDYERKAQAMTYDGQRAMFEAYGRNKYTSTGVIQWMLNNSWPSLIWHLYDYYLVPAGGYFGTKKSMEPIHVQYGYDDKTIAVVNDTYEPHAGMIVTARVLDLNGKELAKKSLSMTIPADAAVRAFDLPKAEGLGMTFFLKLELRDNKGKLVSDNFYWLSAKDDTLNWAGRSDTVYTPQAEFADLTGLNGLQPMNVSYTSALENSYGHRKARVKVKNEGNGVAFMVHLRLADAKGNDVVPVLWEDNYFSLLPGESREISATFDGAPATSTPPHVVCDGWNVRGVKAVAKAASPKTPTQP